MIELHKQTETYMVGYFDDGEFWSCAEAKTLEDAQKLLTTYPKNGKNVKDGLPTNYVILKKTTSYTFV
jgi:hypothetical protein